MFKKRKLALTASTALAVALFAANSSYAAEPGANANEELQEVVITGSRILSPNQVSGSPITVVSSEELKLQGSADVSDVFNNLPQNFQNNKSDFSNTTNPLSGPGGITTANLRGLGPQRTLVLVNGRRLGIGDPNTGNTNPAPDLDQIPASLVERVEVVTGGASADYGSDAIGGVVNFILKRNFTGVQFDAQYGFDQHRNTNKYMQGLIAAKNFTLPDGSYMDGQNRALSVTFGSGINDGTGSFEGYLAYHSTAPVLQGERDFSACKLNVSAAGVGVCSGSANSNQWVILSGPANGKTYSVVGQQFLPYPQANSNPPPLFNSNPYQYLSRQNTRYQAGFLADYRVNDMIKPYAEFSFMNDRSTTRIGPSGLFEGGDPVTGVSLFNCDNPLMSTQQRNLLCTPAQVAAGTDVQALIGRRNIEGVGRTAYYEHINYRGVVGLKGDLNDAWSYDAYGQYYYTSLYDLQDNYISWNSAEQGLEVVNVGAVPTCKSVVAGTSTSCVPFNIFADNGVTPAQLAFMTTYGTQYGTIKQQVTAGNLNGDLGKYNVRLPMAKDGVRVALGVEYRREHLTFRADKALGSGDLSGGSGASTNIDNGFGVDEYFGEVRVPIVQEKTGVHDLTFEGGYRNSKYTTAVGNVNTYKLALQYSPSENYRFRYAFQRAIRAPNIIELFNPQTVTQSTSLVVDQCAGAAPTASLAACQRTGVTAAQYGLIPQCPAGQCAVLLGGNALLRPEIANTYTIGLTTSPLFLPNFTGSLDYFHIKVEDEIGTVPEDIIFNDCLTSGTPSSCAQVVRTTQGFLFGQTVAGGGYVSGTNVNTAVAVTSGWDLGATYHHALPGKWGSLQVGLNGALMKSNSTKTYKTAPTYECNGLYGNSCQTVNPKWRHQMRFSWQTPANLLVSLQWRYIGGVTLETTTTQPVIGRNTPDTFEGKLGAVSYLDLAAVWTVRPKVELRASINNLSDRDPPLVSSLITGTGAPNTYPTYDLLGRVVSIALTARF
jgi:outer membrane receptor protein involved in Fe transport